MLPGLATSEMRSLNSNRQKTRALSTSLTTSAKRGGCTALKGGIHDHRAGVRLHPFCPMPQGPTHSLALRLGRLRKFGTVSEPTVFIVDDDEACRDSIRELVVAVGLAAAVFSSAFEFLAAFDATWRGCLVLDLRMPRMDGLALQACLREMGAHLPIVFVSGSVDIPTAVQAIRDGAVDFLHKPYPQQQLMDAIGKALLRNLA